MDIGLYIADLLRKQDEVSLPGLGTFSKIRVAGSFDPGSSLFIPPSGKISFTDRVTGYNSLADHLSSEKNISISSSEYFIRKFISNILETLQNNGIAEVKPLGILHKDQDTLVFEASADFIPENKYFGLRPLSENIPAPLPEPAKEAEKDVFSNVLSATDEQENTYLEEEETERRRSTTTLIWALILAVLITAGLLYLFNTQVMSFIRQWSSPAASTAPAAVTDSPGTEVQPVVTDSILNNLPDAAVSSAVADSSTLHQPLAAESVRYEIIGAGFGRRADAEIYIKELNSKGISAKIVEDLPGRLLKVSLGTYSDYQLAETELIRIREELNDQAWIAPVNPQKNQ